jgi:predicted nucleotidyltransferase
MSFPISQKLLEGVVRSFDPVEVYLFGSQARGDARSDSDIDLYVVLEDERLATFDLSKAVGEARSGSPEAVDIVLATRSSHERFQATPGAMARTVRREGIRIYAR